jgi:ferredoxin
LLIAHPQHLLACLPRALQGGYILDAALEAGLELPFTCKGGICGCCVGRVADGQADQSDVSGHAEWEGHWEKQRLQQ